MLFNGGAKENKYRVLQFLLKKETLKKRADN
jgi:hypothetical protein